MTTETGEEVQRNEEGIVLLKSSSTLLVSVEMIDNNGFVVCDYSTTFILILI